MDTFTMSTLISTDQVVFATREGKSWRELCPSGPWLSVLLFASTIWWYFGPVIGIWRYFTAVTACNKCPLTVTPPGGAIKSNPEGDQSKCIWQICGLPTPNLQPPSALSPSSPFASPHVHSSNTSRSELNNYRAIVQLTVRKTNVNFP